MGFVAELPQRGVLIKKNSVTSCQLVYLDACLFAQYAQRCCMNTYMFAHAQCSVLVFTKQTLRLVVAVHVDM